MPPKDRIFKSALTEAEYEDLRALAELNRCTMAEIIRQAITYRADMQLRMKPTCAHGRGCFVAAMHYTLGSTATRIDNPTPEQRAFLINAPHALASNQ